VIGNTDLSSDSSAGVDSEVDDYTSGSDQNTGGGGVGPLTAARRRGRAQDFDRFYFGGVQRRIRTPRQSRRRSRSGAAASSASSASSAPPRPGDDSPESSLASSSVASLSDEDGDDSDGGGGNKGDHSRPTARRPPLAAILAEAVRHAPPVDPADMLAMVNTLRHAEPAKRTRQLELIELWSFRTTEVHPVFIQAFMPGFDTAEDTELRLHLRVLRALDLRRVQLDDRAADTVDAYVKVLLRRGAGPINDILLEDPLVAPVGGPEHAARRRNLDEQRNHLAAPKLPAQPQQTPGRSSHHHHGGHRGRHHGEPPITDGALTLLLTSLHSLPYAQLSTAKVGALLSTLSPLALHPAPRVRAALYSAIGRCRPFWRSRRLLDTALAMALAHIGDASPMAARAAARAMERLAENHGPDHRDVLAVDAARPGYGTMLCPSIVARLAPMDARAELISTSGLEGSRAVVTNLHGDGNGRDFLSRLVTVSSAAERGRRKAVIDAAAAAAAAKHHPGSGNTNANSNVDNTNGNGNASTGTGTGTTNSGGKPPPAGPKPTSTPTKAPAPSKQQLAAPAAAVVGAQIAPHDPHWIALLTVKVDCTAHPGVLTVRQRQCIALVTRTALASPAAAARHAGCALLRRMCVHRGFLVPHMLRCVVTTLLALVLADGSAAAADAVLGTDATGIIRTGPDKGTGSTTTSAATAAADGSRTDASPQTSQRSDPAALQQLRLASALSALLLLLPLHPPLAAHLLPRHLPLLLRPLSLAPSPPGKMAALSLAEGLLRTTACDAALASPGYAASLVAHAEAVGSAARGAVGMVNGAGRVMAVAVGAGGGEGGYTWAAADLEAFARSQVGGCVEKREEIPSQPETRAFIHLLLCCHAIPSMIN
jgi:hypothetical protein